MIIKFKYEPPEHALASQNIVALCDVDQDYAAHTFEKYPSAKLYTDYREMQLELDLDGDGDIDIFSKAWGPRSWNGNGGKMHVDFLENMLPTSKSAGR